MDFQTKHKKKSNYSILGFQLRVSTLFCLLSLCNIHLSGQSNEGTEFWFGFMEHRDQNQNAKVAMITSKYNTAGIINLPNQSWSQNFNVAANEVVLIPLPLVTENIGSEITDNVGVKVVSDDLISVYIHQYHNFRSEATLVLPARALDNEYYVMTYRGLDWNGQVYPSEFLIVGTEDETSISITVANATVGGKDAGITFNILLNKGETYQVQAISGTGDLTGSHISGDKNFAVFGGNSWTEVPAGCGARDNLLEQMFPVSTWGKQFVTVPNEKVSYDVFRILASENNTQVEVFEESSSQSFVINAGKFVEYSGSDASYITANKPVQVAQYNIGSHCNGYALGDPSMVLLNSIEQTRDTVTLYNSGFQNISENFINVIFQTADLSSITFDGQDISSLSTINTIGLNDEFSFARLQVSNGAHTVISGGCGVIATAYGYGDLESYAYSGGASFKNINANPIPEGGCLNDTILFDSGLPEERYSVFWDLGDGNATTASRFSHFYPDLGFYTVELIITDECLGTMDTVNRDLLISLRQAVDAAGDTLICEGESFSLSATDLSSARFEWTGPSGYFSENQFPVIENAVPKMSGNYAVVGIISGCATFPAYASVEVIPTPGPDLGPDTIFCNMGSQAVLDPGEYAVYQWQDGSDQRFYNIQEEGDFWVEVRDQYGCVGSDTVSLRQICPTEIYVPNAFTPNFDGTNDYFQVFGHSIISMQLRIFDRWGTFIFEGNTQEEHWDGTFKGQDVQEGVYVWQLSIEGYREDGSVYTEMLYGSVTVIK